MKKRIKLAIREDQKIKLDEYQPQNPLNKLLKIILILTIILTILSLSIILLRNIDKTTIEPITHEIKEPLTNDITGNWQSEEDSLLSFQTDNKFYWYNSYKEKSNNYYSGTYNYKIGTKALEEMGYTKKEFDKEFGENIKLNNIYSINMKPTSSIKNGIDTTNSELNENDTWWFILIIRDNNQAYGYNKTLDIKYNLVKTKTE